MATQLLIDTDVLIDYLRDYPDAVSYVEAQQERLLISVVTVAELYAGVREGEERSRLERFLRAFEIIPLDQRLAVQGGLYRRDYSGCSPLKLGPCWLITISIFSFFST